jgi:hypothetical protein
VTAAHDEHATVVAIANRLFERDEVAWRVMLARAHRLDITLLALIYHRLRDVRDAVAREAFTAQEDFGVVAWERRQAIRREADPNPRIPRTANAAKSLGSRAAARNPLQVVGDGN